MFRISMEKKLKICPNPTFKCLRRRKKQEYLKELILELIYLYNVSHILVLRDLKGIYSFLYLR